MMRKTHHLHLKDTSAAEMAKIQQLLLAIAAMDEEYEKTNKNFDKIALNIAGQGASINVVLLWLKENLGNPSVILNAKTFSYPANQKMLVTDKAGKPIIFYRHQMEAVVNLRKLEFKVIFQDSTAQAFLLTIRDVSSNKTFVFETVFFEALFAIVKEIGYDLDAFKKEIIAQYKIQYLAVKSDKEKLNKLFKVIPDFVLSKILAPNSIYEEIKFGWPDYLDKGESVLNILSGLRYEDEDEFYCFMQKHPFTVMQIYDMLSGTDRANFVSLMAAISEKRAKKPNGEQFTVLPDGWWWDTHEMKANWNSSGTIKITGLSQVSSNFTKRVINATPAYGSSQKANEILVQPPQPGTDRALEEYIKPHFITPPFSRNPLDFIGIRTLAGSPTDALLVNETYQTALTAKYIADELDSKVFWEVINILTSVLGIGGAVRVFAIKGGGWLLKTAAGVEIAKEVLELSMLNNTAKKALTDAGCGAIVENWTTISIVSDMAFLSLDGVLTLAAKSKKSIKVLEEIKYKKQEKLLEKQAEKAYEFLEQKTGVDVRNMSEVEFDEFIKNNPVLEKTHEKVIKDWKDLGANTKGTSNYSPHEIETFRQVDNMYGTKFRPSGSLEAGDVVATSGKYKGQSFDPVGVPKKAFERGHWSSVDPLNRQIALDDFINSIKKHFRKIDNPKGNKPKLDRVIIDFKNFDEFNPKLREEVMRVIYSSNFEYKKYVNNNYLDIIN